MIAMIGWTYLPDHVRAAFSYATCVTDAFERMTYAVSPWSPDFSGLLESMRYLQIRAAVRPRKDWPSIVHIRVPMQSPRRAIIHLRPRCSLYGIPRYRRQLHRKRWISRLRQ